MSTFTRYVLGIIGRIVGSVMVLALLIKNAFRSYAHTHQLYIDMGLAHLFVEKHMRYVYWNVFMVVMYWGLFLLISWKFFPPTNE